MPYFHLTTRAQWGLAPFSHRENSREMWTRLQESFDYVFAGMLMPDHLHLLLEARDPQKAKAALGQQLSAFARRNFPGKSLWHPIAPPSLIPDFHHLKRQIRYVHLNPCRRGLVTDTLAWEWSTHRDIIGATASSWVPVDQLKKMWKTGHRDFAQTFHQYVSSDPTVSVVGTPLPRKMEARQLIAPLRALSRAVIEATRLPADSIAVRHLIMRLNERMGLQRRSSVAASLGLSDRSIRRVLSQPLSPQDEAALRAACWLLSDPKQFGLLQIAENRPFDAA
jgi:REP element-mobilizing transposase RayT